MKATFDASVKETQKVLLNLFKEVKLVLESNNIPYYLIYGSLLGAVRHKGFIPWDDDLDLCIDKKYYEIAISLLKDKLPETILVHNKETDPIYWLPFTKIRYKNSKTTCLAWPEDNSFIHTGISLDIYRYWKEERWSVSLKKVIATKETLCRISNPVNKFSKLGIVLRKLKYTFLLFKYIVLHAIAKKKSMYCLDPISMSKPIYPEDIEDMVFIDFEDVQAPIPKGYDRILRDEYGAYMSLPPENERQRLYSRVEIYA